MSESTAVNFIDVPRTNPSSTKRATVLLAESDLGEKANGGGRFFETAHGTFASVKDAEVFAQRHFRVCRWVVAERITRENGQTTYEYKSKPRSPRD